MTTSEQSVPTFTLTQCTFCGSPTTKRWCVTYDRLYETSTQEFTYSHCGSCRSIFLSTGPDEAHAYRFYPENYGPYFSFDTNPAAADGRSVGKQILFGLSKAWNIFFRRIESNELPRTLDKFYGGGKAVLLDFGCGSEHFLNIARGKSWEGIGMDFSSQTISQVIANGHKGILYDNEKAWDQLNDGSVDVVRMNHVVEHLYKPETVLKNLYSKLRSGGRIHLSTPNSGSFTSAIFNKYWLGLDCPRHVILYNPSSLMKLLEEAGFKDVRIVHEIVTKDIARSIGFRQHAQGKISHSDIGAKVNDRTLQSILYAPAVLSVLFKRSDRIHAFASK